MFLTTFDRSRYNIRDAFREMDRLERAFFQESIPSLATDIIDEGNAYRLEIELPGFAKEEIEVSLEGKYLTVTAKHAPKEASDADESTRYIRRERGRKEVTRSFTVNGIDTNGIEVAHENGVLSILLPRIKPAEPEIKRFEIK